MTSTTSATRAAAATWKARPLRIALSSRRLAGKGVSALLISGCPLYGTHCDYWLNESTTVLVSTRVAVPSATREWSSAFSTKALT